MSTKLNLSSLAQTQNKFFSSIRLRIQGTHRLRAHRICMRTECQIKIFFAMEGTSAKARQGEDWHMSEERMSRDQVKETNNFRI